MRKALVLLIGFFALSLCGAVCAYTDAIAPREEVVVTESLRAGDLSAADGLSLTVHTGYKYNLFWSSHYTPGRPEATTSDYRVSIEKDYGSLNYEDTGIRLSVEAEGYFDHDSILAGPENLSGLEKAYYELWEETPAGEMREKTVYLKDYMDYYPIGGEIDIPGLTLWFDQYYLQDDEYSRYVHGLINDYFRIPVLEDEKRSLSLSKNEDGELKSRGGGSGDGECYYLWTDYAALPDAIYFTISNRTNQNTLVDTSLIPGGYGIYRLPYFAAEGGAQVNVEELSTVKSLDENFEVLYMFTDEPREKLLLVGALNGSLRLLVIDAATMETLQDIEIVSDGNIGCYQYFDGGDFLVLFIHDDRTALLERDSNGEYSLRFVIADEADGSLYNRYNVSDMAWNGEKLALSGFKAMDDINQYYVADFYYAVFDETGLLCFVDCDSSLSLPDEEWNCVRGIDLEPMELEWK